MQVWTCVFVSNANTLHSASYHRGSLPDFFDTYALDSLSISYSGLTAGNSTSMDGALLPNFAMYDRQADHASADLALLCHFYCHVLLTWYNAEAAVQ